MIGVRWQAPERRQPTVKNLIAAEEIRARIGVTGLQVPSLLHCMSPLLAHSDLASRIHVGNAPEADKPEPTRMTQSSGKARYVTLFRDTAVKLPVKRIIVGPADGADERSRALRRSLQ